MGSFLGGGGDGPDAPDYMGLSRQQYDLDKQAANDITRSNRPDQYDAMGNSLTWEQGADGQWTQRQNYSPEVLQQFTGQVNRSNQAGDIYGGLLNRLGNQQPFQGPDMPTYDQNSGDKVAQAMYDSGMSRLGPQQEKDRAAMENRMRLQGLDPQSQAYSTGMGDLQRTQGDVNSKLALDSVGAGYQEARDLYSSLLRGQSQDWGQQYKEYGMPWEQAQRAGGMAADRYIPTMPGFSAATGYGAQDVLGASNAQYNASMGQNNSQNDKMGSTINTGMNMMGMFM